jgi:cation transport ATPase
LIAPIEPLSEHPLGLAVFQYTEGREVPALPDQVVYDLQSIPGRSVQADIGGQTIACWLSAPCSVRCRCRSVS